MKRIFVVSWFFPPLNSSEGVLTWKLLRRSRYPCDVFTQERSEKWSYGTDGSFPNDDRLRRIPAKSTELRDWEKEARRFFSAHRDEYDVVMTRSMPPECHRVGLWIKSHYPGKKWIASFGDPIKDNPYELLGNALLSPWSMKNPLNRDRRLLFRLSPLRVLRLLLWDLRHAGSVLRRRELARIQRETLRKADRLIFNNLSQQRYMTEGRYRDKSVLIRHCHERALTPPPPERTDGRLRFVFTGQLGALRSPRPLLLALAQLKELVPDLADRAEFLFFGEMGDADLAFILRRDLQETARVFPPVSYRRSLREMAAADWLIHIDANLSAVSEENVFFAGKLADYFSAGKPILAVTMPQGDAADCLRRAGALVCSFCVNEIAQALYQVIVLRRRAEMDETVLRLFSAEHAAEEFDEKVVKPLL